MLTIDALRTYGANVEEGLERMMNNEAFYLRMVNMILNDTSAVKLRAAVEAGELNTGFEVAHALKGIAGNLSLTPLYDKTVEITELLRAGTEMDYGPLLDGIDQEFARIHELAGLGGEQ
ncbi:MAG: Hpt domain-containing protein [Oscillospiraceae bacterium]|nr:Hpt domain-containing protein [Oscillospiraceae bacterium]